MEPPGKQAQPGLGAEAPIKKFSQPPSDPAVVALRMEDLTVWVVERVAKMPRDHKFTVGDKLCETCLQVTTLLTEASYVRDKVALLAAASRALTRARVLVRIAQRLRLLSDSQRESRQWNPAFRQVVQSRAVCPTDCAGVTYHSPPGSSGLAQRAEQCWLGRVSPLLRRATSAR